MSDPHNARPPQRRRRAGRRPRRVDIWALPPALPAPEPITGAGDPTSLLRSLGPPPLGGHSTTAEHYMAAVIERAAGIAIALAAAADLWRPPTAGLDED
ncbi:MAG: hypothetical protein ACYCS2_01060 [Acidimicrobiales bacterium]